MDTVNIHDAKTHLSKLLARVQKGENIVIGKAGKPIAKLVPYDAPILKEPRALGQWQGKIRLAPDWDAPDPELENLFYNGPLFPDKKPGRE